MVIIVNRFKNLARSKNVFANNCYRRFCRGSVAKQEDAVNEAEKIVGYHTSFLNLKWLLNDEAANLVLNWKKVIGHPLLAVARDLVLNPESPSWGLIVLLVSKAGGLAKTITQLDYDVATGILHNQRVLAEISEMLRTSNIIHKTIVQGPIDAGLTDVLHFGNKIGLLSGDYILANVFKNVSDLRQCDISWLVASCLRDLSEASFFEPTDRRNRPFPARPVFNEKEIAMPNDFDKSIRISEVLGNAKVEWTLRQVLGGASTLGRCCQGAIQLVHQSPTLQNASYLVGRNTALALQISKNIFEFESNKIEPFCLINAPLMFHLQEEPEYYDDLMKDIEDDTIDYTEIREEVSGGNGISKSLELKEEFVNSGIQALSDFSDSSSKDALINLLRSI